MWAVQDRKAPSPVGSVCVFPAEEICDPKLLYHPWYLFSVFIHTVGMIFSAFEDRCIHSAIHWASKVSGNVNSEETKMRLTVWSGWYISLGKDIGTSGTEGGV